MTMLRSRGNTFSVLIRLDMAALMDATWGGHTRSQVSSLVVALLRPLPPPFPAAMRVLAGVADRR